MSFNATSVGLDMRALSVLAHAIDEGAGRVKPAPLCPDHGEILGGCANCMAQFRWPLRPADGLRTTPPWVNRHVTGTTRKPVRRWWMRWCATPKPR